MTWILILGFWAGAMAESDSVALTTATFKTQAACTQAGELAKSRLQTMKKSLGYVCVPDSK